MMASIIAGCTTVDLSKARSIARQRLKDPAKCLEIVVESEPSGAAVYGVANPGLNLLQVPKPGTYLGKTPLTIRYTRAKGIVFGAYPDETLDLKEFDTTPLRQAHAYLAFQCMVLKDGFEQVTVKKVIEDQELDLGPADTAKVESLTGGKRVVVTSKLVAAEGVTHAELRKGHSLPTEQVVAKAAVQGVSIVSVPKGAEVYVDGDFVGNAPCTLPLPPGKHLIEVKKSGYANFSRNLKVFKDTPATVTAELVKTVR